MNDDVSARFDALHALNIVQQTTGVHGPLTHSTWSGLSTSTDPGNAGGREQSNSFVSPSPSMSAHVRDTVPSSVKQQRSAEQPATGQLTAAWSVTSSSPKGGLTEQSYGSIRKLSPSMSAHVGAIQQGLSSRSTLSARNGAPYTRLSGPSAPEEYISPRPRVACGPANVVAVSDAGSISRISCALYGTPRIFPSAASTPPDQAKLAPVAAEGQSATSSWDTASVWQSITITTAAICGIAYIFPLLRTAPSHARVG